MKSEGAGKLREKIHNEAMSEEEKARADLGIAICLKFLILLIIKLLSMF